jgi:hypothetical protein
MHTDIDARHLLRSLTVPRLVLHRVGDSMITVEHGRHLSAHISGAKYVELAGDLRAASNPSAVALASVRSALRRPEAIRALRQQS